MALDLAQSPYYQVSSTRTSADDLGAGQRRGQGSSLSSVVLRCMVSIGLAAAMLCLLSALGMAAFSSQPTPARAGPAALGGYSAREVWKDMRSIVSFVLGALLTSCVGGDFSSSADDDAEESEEQPSKMMERLVFFSTFM